MKAHPAIFVTGATGFVGSHFLKQAAGGPWRFLCLVRSRPKVHYAGVKWILGDLTDSRSWSRHLRGCSALLHLATVPLAECDRNPLRASQVIFTATHRLLEHAVRRGVKRWILGSTAEVYGDPRHLPVSEISAMRPVSLYGFLKGASDLDALSMAQVHAISLCILRFSNLYGLDVRGDIPMTVLGKMAIGITRGEPVILHRSLKNSRDFLHVQDAVSAILQTLEKPQAEGVIPIGSGVETRLVAAARRLASLREVRLRLELHSQEGRLRRGRMDLRRARSCLKFSPKVSLDHGLQELLDAV